MSEMRPGARHVDPLEVLRAADHRPVHEIWRERVARHATSALTSIAKARLHLVVVALVVGLLVWRLFLATEPPVEASIPFAPTAAFDDPTMVTLPEPASGAGRAALPTQRADDPIEATRVVHVAGAVVRPGLVTGASTWRVDDAVVAAGGPVDGADLDRVNLAAVLVDGERIYIPFVGEDAPTVVASAATRLGSEQHAVNVNAASAAELETLPGVGPATAAAILAHRDEHGSFGSVDALVAVRGIGPATIEALRDHVSVG